MLCTAHFASPNTVLMWYLYGAAHCLSASFWNFLLSVLITTLATGQWSHCFHFFTHTYSYNNVTATSLMQVVPTFAWSFYNIYLCLQFVSNFWCQSLWMQCCLQHSAAAMQHQQHKHTEHVVYIWSFVFHPDSDHKHDFSDLASRHQLGSGIIMSTMCVEGTSTANCVSLCTCMPDKLNQN